MERNITQEIPKNQSPALEKNPLKKIGDTPMRYHLIPSAPKSHGLQGQNDRRLFTFRNSLYKVPCQTTCPYAE